MTVLTTVLADSGTVTFFKGWDFTGSFTFVDLVAASTNALNGALLCRRPDHYKMYTIVGVLMMALLGGLGGGITRDVMLGDVPAALTNPAYITLALGFGALGYFLAYAQGQLFREGLFQFMTSFSLPWYAIVGAQKAVGQGIPVAGAMLAGGGRPDGRPLVHRRLERGDAEALHPRRVVRPDRGADGRSSGSSSTGRAGTRGSPPGVAFAVGYTLRVLALWYAWEEPLAKRARRGLQAQRRPATARPQAQRQVPARAARPRPLVEDGDSKVVIGKRGDDGMTRRTPDRIGRSLSMPIEQIEGLPDAVVGLEAVGEVTARRLRARREPRDRACARRPREDPARPRPRRAARRPHGRGALGRLEARRDQPALAGAHRSGHRPGAHPRAREGRGVVGSRARCGSTRMPSARRRSTGPARASSQRHERQDARDGDRPGEARADSMERSEI